MIIYYIITFNVTLLSHGRSAGRENNLNLMTFLAQSVLCSVSFYVNENTGTDLKRGDWKCMRNTAPNHLDIISTSQASDIQILFPETYLDLC